MTYVVLFHTSLGLFLLCNLFCFLYCPFDNCKLYYVIIQRCWFFILYFDKFFNTNCFPSFIRKVFIMSFPFFNSKIFSFQLLFCNFFIPPVYNPQKVSDILSFSGLPSHPQHQLMKTQTSGCSGVFSFYLKGGLKEAEKFVSNLNYFTYTDVTCGLESTISIP